LQQRYGLTRGRKVEQISPPPQRRHPSNNKENILTIPKTQQESKRSTRTPTPATIIDECKHIVRGRIHYNISSRKQRSHSAQKNKTLTITTSNPLVLQGCKENQDNLWTVSANEEGEEEANNVYNLPSTKQSIRYLHASAGFPVESKWIKAIKEGNYVTWPELTAEAVHKHFPESDETQKGHMKQQCQNVRSAKVKQNTTDKPEKETHQDIPQAKLKDVYIEIYLANNTVHFDQTGCFPATSSRGNTYIMVLVEINGNYIDAELMKNKIEGSMIKAYLALWECLTATGIVKPTTHIMDNEASAEYKKVIHKNCTIQLVPPNC
jgi:hypothetical protein